MCTQLQGIQNQMQVENYDLKLEPLDAYLLMHLREVCLVWKQWELLNLIFR